MAHRFVALAFSLALSLNMGPALAQTTVAERIEKGQPPVIIAHRRATMDGQPENSLGWIARAIDRGIDMVHINPQQTGDGHYVLMHTAFLTLRAHAARKSEVKMGSIQLFAAKCIKVS